MIHVVTQANRHIYQRELEASLRLRHQVFVKERKWTALTRADGREIDQFDTEHAVYLLAIERDTIVGGCRLVPTIEPNLLSHIMPHLAQNPIPNAPNIMEWGRMHVAAQKRENHAMNLIACQIWCGVLEYALSHAIEKLVIVGEAFLLPRFLGLGWHPEPLGIPQSIDNIGVVAFTVEPSYRALELTRKHRDIEGSVLVIRGGEHDHHPLPESIRS
jgi:acyl-homoserine lactone synthase